MIFPFKDTCGISWPEVFFGVVIAAMVLKVPWGALISAAISVLSWKIADSRERRRRRDSFSSHGQPSVSRMDSERRS